jgi:hypothetical protein
MKAKGSDGYDRCKYGDKFHLGERPIRKEIRYSPKANSTGKAHAPLIEQLAENGMHTTELVKREAVRVINGSQGIWRGNAYPHDLHLPDFNQPMPWKGKKRGVWE